MNWFQFRFLHRHHRLISPWAYNGSVSAGYLADILANAVLPDPKEYAFQ